MRASKKRNNDIHLQDIVGMDREGNEVRIEDRIADDKDPIDDLVGLRLQIKRLKEILVDTLHGREKKVVEMRYGLDGKEEQTQREIADALNISRSYVSRIEKKALCRLNKELQA